MPVYGKFQWHRYIIRPQRRLVQDSPLYSFYKLSQKQLSVNIPKNPDDDDDNDDDDHCNALRTNLYCRRCRGRHCSVREYGRYRYSASHRRNWAPIYPTCLVGSRWRLYLAAAGMPYSVSSPPATKPTTKLVFTARCYAEYSDATLSRPSVCLPVRLSVCDVLVRWSHRLEYFENNFTA